MFCIFAVSPPEVGTTSLPWNFAEHLQGSGLFSQINICGILLSEASVALHLPNAMSYMPDHLKAFLGPTHHVRRAYTMSELKCVEQVLKYQEGVAPSYFRSIFHNRGLANHFELMDIPAPPPVLSDSSDSEE